MAITDEDLAFMADGMWKDAFLPDLPDIYGIDIDADGKPIELSAPGDMLLGSNDNGEGNSSSRKKAAPAAKQVKAAKGKGKASGVSSMTDLYLSSPTEVRPKTNGKMSKSMKGASQNESQRGRPPGPAKPHKPNSMFPELETDNGDPYELPISPKSMHRPQTVVEFDKKLSHKGTFPVSAPPKPSSPLEELNPSSKKPVKNQKRVAKRSFLDPPSTPHASETKVQMPPPPKPAFKEAAPVARPVKPPPQPKATKKPAAEKKQAKPRESKKKTVSRPTPVKQEKIDDGPEEEDRIPDDVPAAEDITKKLRPRGERAPILISSDPASSDEDEEEYEEDAAFVPNTGTTSFTTPVAQIDPPDSVARPSAPSSPKQGKHVLQSTTTPAERAAIDRDIDEYIRRNSAAFETTVRVKKDVVADGKETGRGRQASSSGQLLEKQNTHQKRQRSPAAAAAPARHQGSKKKKKAEPVRSEPVRSEPVRAETASVESQARKVLQQMDVPQDPFVENMEEDEPQPTQTHFTTKLLQSTAPPVQPVPSVQSQPSQHGDSHQYRTQDKSHYVQPVPVPRALPRDQLDGLPHARATHQHNNVNQARFAAIESDGIAREMMKLLSSGANSPQNKPQSAKDIWLDETDPYKETGQIMGYVCKTVLRFLKSKEAAIEDVAEEYQQRGGAVLDRMSALHGSERQFLAHTFEQSRQRSLAVFKAAESDVHLLATRLERVNLVPVIQNVLADNAGSRLRLLQTEIM